MSDPNIMFNCMYHPGTDAGGTRIGHIMSHVASTIPATERVGTLQLREGDTVWIYGMRVRLGVRKERESRIEGLTVPLVAWFHGTVINAAELPNDGLVSRSYRTDSRCTECAPGEHWQVQGNERARWHREL